VRDLTSLAVGMPNVALDEVGTTKGTANSLSAVWVLTALSLRLTRL